MLKVTNSEQKNIFSQRTLNVHDVRMLLHLAVEVATFAVNFY